jgi:hypothetical protein
VHSRMKTSNPFAALIRRVLWGAELMNALVDLLPHSSQARENGVVCRVHLSQRHARYLTLSPCDLILNLRFEIAAHRLQLMQPQAQRPQVALSMTIALMAQVTLVQEAWWIRTGNAAMQILEHSRQECKDLLRIVSTRPYE